MKKTPAWLLVAASFMIVLFSGQKIVTHSKMFEVVHSQATVIPGYEGSPEGARVYASPEIKWAKVPAVWKIGGWIFFFLIVGSAFYVHNSESSNGKSIAILLAPTVLCGVFWYAGYSASLDQGSVLATIPELQNTYGLSDAQIVYIRTHSGVTNIKDESGKLTAYFKNK